MPINSLVQSASTNQGVSTAISLIVDRSGSMSPYVSKVAQSISEFIDTQSKNRGEAYLSLSQFDHEYDAVFKNRNIKEVDRNTFTNEYQPRGATAMRDALVQAVQDMEGYLKTFKKRDMPERLVIGLITDGDDNASKHSADTVCRMIQEKEKLGWDFLLLGVESNTMDVANELCIGEKKAAMYLADAVGNGIGLLSDKVSAARAGLKVDITSKDREDLLRIDGPMKKDEL